MKLNTSQISKKFKIPKRTLERWRYEGKGPSYEKTNKGCLYEDYEVRCWMAKVVVSPELSRRYRTVATIAKRGVRVAKKLGQKRCVVCNQYTNRIIGSVTYRAQIWYMSEDTPLCSKGCERIWVTK